MPPDHVEQHATRSCGATCHQFMCCRGQHAMCLECVRGRRSCLYTHTTNSSRHCLLLFVNPKEKCHECIEITRIAPRTITSKRRRKKEEEEKGRFKTDISVNKYSCVCVCVVLRMRIKLWNSIHVSVFDFAVSMCRGTYKEITPSIRS